MGTTDAIFHASGKQPERMDKLNKCIMAGAILAAVDFNIFAEMLSCPDALVVSRDNRRCKTFSSVHRYSSGTAEDLSPILSHITMKKIKAYIAG